MLVNGVEVEDKKVQDMMMSLARKSGFPDVEDIVQELNAFVLPKAVERFNTQEGGQSFVNYLRGCCANWIGANWWRKANRKSRIPVGVIGYIEDEYQQPSAAQQEDLLMSELRADLSPIANKIVNCALMGRNTRKDFEEVSGLRGKALTEVLIDIKDYLHV